jgi:hypothetical protein
MVKRRLAGAGGFEPPNAGTKNRCLTTWRRPNIGVGRPYSGPVIKGNRSIEAHNPIMGVSGDATLNSDQTILQSLRHLARAACTNGEAARWA